MSVSTKLMRALDPSEKNEIAVRLRGGESPRDLAFQFRVPDLWVFRIADAIKRADAAAKREKMRRSLVQSVAARGRSNARNLLNAPTIAPSMKVLCSMDSIRISKREEVSHDE